MIRTNRASAITGLLLLSAFLLMLVGAISQYGAMALLRPKHLTLFLLIVTCYSARSVYLSRSNAMPLFINCVTLGVCLLFVSMFVFLATTAPVISQD